MQMNNTVVQWFGRVVWIGITVNVLLVIPCFFFPEKMSDLLGLTRPDSTIWVRSYGLLVLIISAISIPAALSPLRHRALTIMHTPGARLLVFLISVLSRGQETAFLAITLVDLFLGVVVATLVLSSSERELIQTVTLVPRNKQRRPGDYVKQG